MVTGHGKGMTELEFSYVHGVAPTPLVGRTIGRQLDLTAARFGEREALVVPYQGVRWRYAEFNEIVTSCAAGLLSLGLKPGDRIGVWSPNNREWVVAQYASARAGLVLVNINPAYRVEELEFALAATGCKMLVVAPSFKSSDYVSMLAGLLPELETPGQGRIYSSRLPALRHLAVLGPKDVPGFMRFDSIAGKADDFYRQRLREIGRQLQFDDPVNIQFTSGTTGKPKAATLTHHNILNNALFSAEAMGFTCRDRLCLPVPMYHCFGMVLGSLLCVGVGAAMVLPSEGFDANAALQSISEDKCTAVHGVPTMFISMLDQVDFDRFDLSSLRTGIMAGAPCAEALMRKVADRMHLDEITIAYGMTETGPLSFQTSVRDSLERRITTVGRVLPHVEVKIVDDQDRVTSIGEAGELKTRGYNVMRGYWNDAQRTRDAIDSAGWIASGDIATLDSEGYCRIVGRLKDMLIRGGENIFPREIEEFLYTHPKIDAVEVFGVPDVKYGEAVAAWIRLVRGESMNVEEVRSWCRERIAHYKIPVYIKFVEEFPTTATGKVQKFVMRKLYARELGLDSTGK